MRKSRIVIFALIVCGLAVAGWALRARIADLPLVGSSLPLTHRSTATAEPAHGSSGGDDSSAAAPTSSAVDATGVLYWTCPMHPEVRSDKPGTHDTPDCGMDLVPVRR